MFNLLIALPFLFVFPAGHIEASPIQIQEVIPVKEIEGDCDSYLPEIKKYDWNPDIVKAIAQKESGCRPSNHNDGDIHRNKKGEIICLGSFNILNVGCIHYAKTEDINDVALNFAKAYKIYLERGRSFSAWTTCKEVKGCS